ncbi:transcription factor [Schizosaccharomyces cryophilus OY26]|uniref:Transcription factor n=1 Tax=Schizosaccharomyces cryophilus (strain OY26 / ATCC MYA-4695 / CBS 11777 / NBRC 106824 / NRRL Y48691) TaxID=653667 RepID=S9W4K0_SCHCR|nr:transcription factor [Schizosaccharomyces cryophilus OY26]EPY53449.1 transcription factor [Schizosaccharomyces cryophilus OY26]
MDGSNLSDVGFDAHEDYSKSHSNVCIPCALGTCLIHFREFSSSSFVDPVSLFCLDTYPNADRMQSSSEVIEPQRKIRNTSSSNPFQPFRAIPHPTPNYPYADVSPTESKAKDKESLSPILKNKSNITAQEREFSTSYLSKNDSIQASALNPGFSEKSKSSSQSYYSPSYSFPSEFPEEHSPYCNRETSKNPNPLTRTAVAIPSRQQVNEGSSTHTQGASLEEHTDDLGFDDSLSYAYILNPTSDSDVDLIRQYFISKEGSYSINDMHIKYVSADPKTPIMYMVDPAYEPSKQVARYEKLQEIFEFLDATVDSVLSEKLISLYFLYIHPTYPVVHRERFLLLFKNAKHKISPILLMAMYAASILYWNADESLRDFPRVDSKKLWDMTEESLNQSFSLPRLSTLQAAVIFLVGRPWINVAGNWSILTRAVALALILGFHLDCSDWQIPEEEKVLRIRTWWALFISEKWLSMYIGINTSIRQDDYLVPPLSVTQLLPSESMYADSFKVFMKMSELSVFLQTILQNLFTVRAVMSMSKNRRSVAQKITKYLAELDEFTKACEFQRGTPGVFSLYLQIDALELLLRKTVLKMKLTDSRFQNDMLVLVERCITRFLSLDEGLSTDFFWPYSQFYFCILASSIIKMYLDFEFNENYNTRIMDLLTRFTKHCVWLKRRNFDLIFMAYKRLNALLLELSTDRPPIKKLLQTAFETKKRTFEATM